MFTSPITYRSHHFNVNIHIKFTSIHIIHVGAFTSLTFTAHTCSHTHSHIQITCHISDFLCSCLFFFSFFFSSIFIFFFCFFFYYYFYYLLPQLMINSLPDKLNEDDEEEGRGEK